MAITQGSVIAPTGSAPLGSTPNILAGRQSDLMASALHGESYAASYNNMVFGNLGVSVTLPVSGATLASKWCLRNPAGSGRLLELIHLDYFVLSATDVVGAVGLTKATEAVAGLNTLTPGTINCLNVGGSGASVCTFYSAATHADTPVIFKNLIGVNATANGITVPHFEFKGTVLIQPGWVIDLIAVTGAQTTAVLEMTWAEWPI